MIGLTCCCLFHVHMSFDLLLKFLNSPPQLLVFSHEHLVELNVMAIIHILLGFVGLLCGSEWRKAMF